MGTTSFLTSGISGTGPVAPTAKGTLPPLAAPSDTEPRALAALLAAVGPAIESLPAEDLDRFADRIAALTAHLLDGAADAGAPRPEFIPSRGTPVALSLRALGRLAARTAGHDLRLDPTRARRIVDLTADLA